MARPPPVMRPPGAVALPPRAIPSRVEDGWKRDARLIAMGAGFVLFLIFLFWLLKS